MQNLQIRYAQIIFFFLMLSLCELGWALSSSKQLTYSHAQIQLSHDAISKGQTFWLGFKLSLKPDWHVYWKNPGDSGLPPKLQIKSNQNIEVGEMLYPPPHRILVQHLTNYGYEQDVMYFIPITLKSFSESNELNLKIKADWLVCQEDCIPEQAKFKLSLPIQEKSNPSNFYPTLLKQVNDIQSLPTLPIQITEEEHQALLEFENTKWADQSILDAYLFVAQEDIFGLSQRQAYQQASKKLSLRLDKTRSLIPKSFSGILEVKTEQGPTHYKISVDNSTSLPVNQTQSDQTLTIGWAFLFAFLGGILLNIMPCVFPILSLKVLALCQHQSSNFQSKLFHAISYTVGILLCFLIIGILLISLQSAGLAVGWGFQMQSPSFLLAMIYLLVLVSCFLLGYISFWLPLPQLANGQLKHPYLESFSTGLLITLISTPCTAPLMAPALGFAFTQPPLNLIAIMLLLGFGLATPFILFAIIPGATRWIPKSGPWLNTFKEFLAFPMLFTALWLAWLLQNHIQSLEFILFLGSILCLWMALWVGKLDFKNKMIKWIFQIILIIPLGFTFNHTLTLTPHEKSLQLEQHVFSQQKLDALLQSHNAVFVNVTADWCITCKANESLVLSQQSVKDFLRDNDIIYLKADWTQQDEKITNYLKSFNRFGVPMYVYYPPEGDPILLPQILTPEIIYQNLKQTN